MDFSFLHTLISSVRSNGTVSLHCKTERFPPTQLKPATLYSEINKSANRDHIYSCYLSFHVPTDSVAPLFLIIVKPHELKSLDSLLTE